MHVHVFMHVCVCVREKEGVEEKHGNDFVVSQRNRKHSFQICTYWIVQL